ILLDTAIALLAGLAIFPIVFANGLSAGEGPGLIFVTLPLAFGNMTGGTILGLMFFLLLTFAALTSAISLLEPVVETLEERTSMS
ncbi:sodium-dependent transporter, partial [Guyparkeria sp. 1SP6A2]|nr:sodium-dependent transporter [Guyparkeria sp. 1SP6A2]